MTAVVTIIFEKIKVKTLPQTYFITRNVRNVESKREEREREREKETI